jgi:hypothetical protein
LFNDWVWRICRWDVWHIDRGGGSHCRGVSPHAVINSYNAYKNGLANNQFIHVSWDKCSFARGEEFFVPYSLGRLNTCVILKKYLLKKDESFFKGFGYVRDKSSNLATISLSVVLCQKKNERKKRILRIFTIISALGFLGSAGFSFIRMLTNPAQPTQVSAQAEDLTQQLQAQALGYEMVLQREPENQIALQGLVEIRLQMKDFERTIEPLETLVRLNPEQEQYKTLLATIKQQVEQEEDGKKDEKATSN